MNISTDDVTENGYTLVPQAIRDAEIEELLLVLGAETKSGRQRNGSVYAIRNLLEAVPLVADLARSAALRSLVELVLGKNCFAVRGILFDKTADANWNVLWHQDVTIAVRERRDAPGFSPWTLKAGVPHVQPPAEILERMLTARLHLDDCGPDNGPLRIIPGSHRSGRLNAEAIVSCRAARPDRVITAQRGDILLMRPLLLHASSSADAPGHRRVIHIEYAAEPLPCGLEWHTRI